MYVMCKSADPLTLPPLERGGVCDGFSYWNLIPGQYYIVYAVHISANLVEFRVDDSSLDAPSGLFQVVDPRPSRYWHLRIGGQAGEVAALGFPEYINSPDYLMSLIDGKRSALELFASYRALMDREYPDPRVQHRATSLQSLWVQCASCDDAWQTDPVFAMIDCPRCATKQHNPLYQGR